MDEFSLKDIQEVCSPGDYNKSRQHSQQPPSIYTPMQNVIVYQNLSNFVNISFTGGAAANRNHRKRTSEKSVEARDAMKEKIFEDLRRQINSHKAKLKLKKPY